MPPFVYYTLCLMYKPFATDGAHPIVKHFSQIFFKQTFNLTPPSLFGVTVLLEHLIRHHNKKENHSETF